ncbi:hypothetical protein E1261_14405 [Kribbella albertanoniae]|uniref:Uncharacterized protein n=1 Tax=Kribbella albertanoniae TaxID=1266829 RepID=A0A4R4Q4N3_9ACTN|nr:hypothetical protein E1261_14405 [Kribbella albertanoniae]
MRSAGRSRGRREPRDRRTRSPYWCRRKGRGDRRPGAAHRPRRRRCGTGTQPTRTGRDLGRGSGRR